MHLIMECPGHYKSFEKPLYSTEERNACLCGRKQPVCPCACLLLWEEPRFELNCSLGPWCFQVNPCVQNQ